ncbi:PTS transporter subunit EIIC [Clostridium perfringens]
MSKKGSKVLGFLQRIGKSLMVPIAVMPALGLLLRLGDKDLLNIPWISAAGGAAFGDNMAMLFAVGIGFGLSDENNGVGGLAGLLGFLVMKNVATSFDPSINMGAFGGVVAGVVGGLLYNKFKDIKVPQFLGFFGGKRFVPIITSAVCLILGVFFGYTWPTFQAGLDGFANIMVAAGAIGAGIYGILNRLLIPIGLHHVMNTVIWFQLGSFTDPVSGQIATGDIARFLAGDPTAGVYTAGFYPIMMFGLPAACLAMYVCAKKKNKAVVGGMFLSLALTAIITGITEPIEFAFMFFIKKFNLKTPGREDDFDDENEDAETNSKTVSKSEDNPSKGGTLAEKAEVVLEALGGKENIEVLDNCITRLRLTLKDASKIDEVTLKKAGASGIMKLDGKNVQVIMGTLADPLASQMKKLL